MTHIEQIISAAISHTQLKEKSEMYGELLIIAQNFCTLHKNNLKPKDDIFVGIVQLANSAQKLILDK